MTEYPKTEGCQAYTLMKMMRQVKSNLAYLEEPNIDAQCDWFADNEYNDVSHHDQDHDREIHLVRSIMSMRR